MEWTVCACGISIDAGLENHTMDLVEARSDGNEQLLASGLTPTEAVEVLDWWRYTKPFGPSVRIVVRADAGSIAGVSTTGTYAEPILSSSEHIPSAAESVPQKIPVG
jgi:hypothetical protein